MRRPPHPVYLDPDETPGEVRPRCRTCPWAGTRTESIADADAEGDRHESDPAGSTLWDGTGPYPGAPAASITIQAARILAGLVEDQPTALHTVSDGIAAVALARRGLAVKVGTRGWQRTRRGTTWAQEGRTR